MEKIKIQKTIFRDQKDGQEQQDQFAIKFGVWLSVNCDQDKSKDGWWLYEKTWLTTDECLLKFKNGNTTNTI